MKKFTEIEQFRHVVATITNYYERTEQLDGLPTLNFTGTVKLHGTNAGIRRENGKYSCQSRKQIITPKDDNYGFATWFNNKDITLFEALFNKISTDPKDVITIFGEWIGPKIQDTVAIASLPNKQWVIFGAHMNDQYIDNFVELQDHENGIYNILEIPRYHITVDFKDPSAVLPQLEEVTLSVEQKCPWAAQFDIDGIGEGIVWKCDERPYDSDLWFKTKGEKHSGSGKKSGKKIATIDPQKVENINQCVDIILTEGRLKQGLEHVDAFDMKNIGQYLKWISLDCMKEEMDTVEANELEWKDVVKVVNKRAKDYFIKVIDDSVFNK